MLCPRVIKLPVFIRCITPTKINEWPIGVVLYLISVILSSLHLSIVLEVWNWNAGEECAVLVFQSGSVLGCLAAPGLYSHSTIAERGQDKFQVLYWIKFLVWLYSHRRACAGRGGNEKELQSLVCRKGSWTVSSSGWKWSWSCWAVV